MNAERKVRAVPGVGNHELDGLLRSLAGMPGARAERHESVSVRFEVQTIEQAMEQIKRLQGTGQLTINFANGKASGMAEWKTKP